MDVRESASMNSQSLVLALLREAQSVGVSPMLRTTVVKFLYLLDVYTAEKSNGQPVSGFEWKFFHFGPYSASLARALDDLAAQRVLSVDLKESSDGDKEFAVYSLPAWRKAPDLHDLGIDGLVQARIQADLKRYGKDLQGLLNFVYFKTAPMRDAKPNQILDFSVCEEC